MDTEHKGSLVSSDDVNGTEVYGADGSLIGSINSLMIDKQSGKVAYAVMSFGGFLGMGAQHLPVPWNKLSYDTSREGFITDLTQEQVQAAPALEERWDRDRAWEERTHQHYQSHPYWI